MQKKEKGAWGEAIAAKFLKKLGYKIIDKNIHFQCGEIDLVAKDGDEVVFVEVKARSTNSHGSPLESITPQKLQKLHRSVQLYMEKHNLREEEIRIDVIGILGDTDSYEINHLKSIDIF